MYLSKKYLTKLVDQRKFLDNLANILEIKSPNEWGKISRSQISRNGGVPLLQLYENSLENTLKSVYKEIEWKREWFKSKNIEHSHFSKQKARVFLGNVAKKLNITSPEEWGIKASTKLVVEMGGKSLICYQNASSLFETLRFAFPEIEWKHEWFPSYPRYYFTSHRQKAIMDKIAKDLQIKTPMDWGNFTIEDIKGKGIDYIIFKNQSSLFYTLKSIYPDIQWDSKWFKKYPQNYWKSFENQRKYLEEFALKVGIKHPSDWGRVTSKEIAKENSTILGFHKYSVERMLKFVFPEIAWQREWFFNIPKYKRGHWILSSNQKLIFDNMIDYYSLESPLIFGKSFLLSNGAGSLLKHFKGSLNQIIETLYPNRFTPDLNRSFRKSQSLMEKLVLKIIEGM